MSEFTHSANLDPTRAFEQEVIQRVELLTSLTQPAAETQPEGFLHQAAQAKYQALVAERRKDPDAPPSPDTLQPIPGVVYEALVTVPKGTPLAPRNVLMREAGAAVKAVAAERPQDILEAATQVGMRRTGEREDLSRIRPEEAIFVIEGGANKTSVVRRGVAEGAMRELYGDEVSRQTAYQLGGDRVIAPTITDRETGEEKPNPEFGLIRSLAGDFLPEKTAFTEFDANLATALADGYERMSEVSEHSLAGLPEDVRRLTQINPVVARVIRMRHPDANRPELVLVKPTGKGLEGGFDAVQALTDVRDGQFVIATNGQYRPKDELQAYMWAKTRQQDMIPAVAIGDETGDVAMFKGEPHTTPNRPPLAYINELALYGRQTAQYVVEAARHSQARPYNMPGSVVLGHPNGDEIVAEPDGSTWLRRSGSAGMVYEYPDDPGSYPE